MSVNLLIAFTMVFFAGVGLALQAPVNGSLGAHLGSGLFAALISFSVGFTILLILNLAYANFTPVTRITSTPIWMLAGGFLGVFAVYSSLTNVVKLGALTMVATIMFGQLLAALVIDAFGLGSLQATQISPARILAVAMIGAGIVLSRY